MKKKLWRVSNGEIEAYIRGDSSNDVSNEFEKRYNCTATTFEIENDDVFAVFFTDSPSEPAFFHGTKKKVKQSANLYIKQWGLDARILQIKQL